MPEYDDNLIDPGLEERMEYAQKISSMILALRRKIAIKVRQPLQKIMIPVLDINFKEQVEAVKNLILTEVNVKELEYITDDSGILIKKIKPNFKTLGPKCGKLMKDIASKINGFSNEDIRKFEQEGMYIIEIENQNIQLTLEDVEITSEDIPGWLVANDNKLTVALDITVTEELKREGIARELVNRIQNLRKESGLDVTDKIKLMITRHDEINEAIEKHKNYICLQTLTSDLIQAESLEEGIDIELDENVLVKIAIKKIVNH
jgi:isoleucyl-tRNA synthetase